MYLVEALKYNVPALHEDRLTQIVAATFNESIYFQKLFLKFLGVPYTRGLNARTQVCNSMAPSRPDLILFNRGAPLAIVESKVAAKSDKGQQSSHSRLKAPYYFLIVRDPVCQGHIDPNFKKLTWYDFFSFLLNADRKNATSLDAFLTDKLISFGKASKMLLPDRIQKSDFDNACILFTQVRLMGSPCHSFEKRSPFQSLDSISAFLERMLIKVKDDPEFEKHLKPFVRRLGLASVFYNDLHSEISKEKSMLLRRELRLKTDIVTLEKELKLKNNLNGFQHLFLRVSFVPYYRAVNLTEAKIQFLNSIALKDIKYKCEVDAGLSDVKKEFNAADSVIFDDTEDLEFEYFYKEVVKHWKKKLQLKRKTK